MPVERFQLTYSGEAVRSGAMDVYELAPALIAVGDLIRDTNRLLNGDRAAVDVRVDADFKKSSFEIHFLLDQHMAVAAHETLEFLSAVDAQGLIEKLFGVVGEHGDKIVEGLFLGLFALYKALKGKKPEPGSITIQDNHGTILIDQKQIKTDSTSLQLYLNDPIRADLDRVALPVIRAGIDKLRVSKDGALLDELTKGDLPPRLTAIDAQTESGEQVLRNTREVLVKVVTANFEEGKWKFFDGSSKFSAVIADPVFQEKLDLHEEGFYKGDVLRVLLESTQTERMNGKIQTQHTIREVLEHRQAPGQEPLFPNRRRIK